MNHHLDTYKLMGIEQRGAKVGCSGTMNNLLIDRMVTEDWHRGKRNLSMAWVDVAKAYDSIDHEWLDEMMILHRFLTWLKNVTSKLSASWNTRIQCKTDKGDETSDVIRFRSGLSQGDVLCPRLFTLCMNPVAWMLKATEGYKLSRPIGSKITDLLYIDDLKIFAASQTKLATVMKSTQTAMKDMGLRWNPKKCSVLHVKRGVQQEDNDSIKLDESVVIQSLKQQSHYKSLGVLENIKRMDLLAFESASKEYLKRLSVIWSSPLSDVNKVTALNQYAFPLLSYLMPTQRWPMSELQRINREVRKVKVENGGKHPTGSSALLYVPRAVGGRGMKSVETAYKVTKIKTALKIQGSTYPTVKLVKNWDENSARSKGRHSTLEDAVKYAREFGLDLDLTKPNTTCQVVCTGDEIIDNKIPDTLKNAITSRLQQEVMDQKWQGEITAARWKDQDLSLKECYTWLKGWKAAPTHTIAGIEELHQQLLPTKIYHQKKTEFKTDDIMCGMFGEKPESLAHVLAGCSVLAQTKYLSIHNAALKIPFFEMLNDMELIESTPPWYSPVQPKPVYQNDRAEAYWDVPVYEHYNFRTAVIVPKNAEFFKLVIKA